MSRRGRALVCLVGCVGLAGCAAAPPYGAASTLSIRPSASASSATASSVTPTASLAVPSVPEPGRELSRAEQALACLPAASELSLAQQVGQLYMMAINEGTPLQTATAQLQASGAGAVILLGNRTQSQAQIAEYLQSLQDGAQADVPVLVAVDQEGGLVQRLAGEGFDVIPPAIEQSNFDDAYLRTQWQRWGGQLRAAGVHVDLAPVADVVPADEVATNQAIGQLQRGYGADPDAVARSVADVVQGLADAGVGSSVKHFPGLGRVPENTDLAVGHDTVSLLTDAELAPFQSAIDAGVSSVMVSSAIYTRVDSANPAVFSPGIVTGILRERMGFEGVIVSDDLGVAAAVAGYPVGRRGLLFLQAGGDLVIVAEPQAAQMMVDATVVAAQSDPAFAEAVSAKVARLFALKADLGLMTCR